MYMFRNTKFKKANPRAQSPGHNLLLKNMQHANVGSEQCLKAKFGGFFNEIQEKIKNHSRQNKVGIPTVISESPSYSVFSPSLTDCFIRKILHFLQKLD